MKKQLLKSLKSRKFLLPLLILSGLLLLKYACYYLNYEALHVVVQISSFCFYFMLFFYLVRFFVKQKKIILANILILFMLVLLVEVTCYFLLGLPKQEWKDYSITELPEDHIGTHLGHVPWADSVWHDVKYADDQKIFDTYYTVDKHNRRVVPNYNPNKTKYAAFFGCSICYGFGLKDDQTIPYYLSLIHI